MYDYSITVRNSNGEDERVLSSEILTALNNNHRMHRADIAAIKRLQKDGCRYSYEDYDVLSAALTTIIRNV